MVGFGFIITHCTKKTDSLFSVILNGEFETQKIGRELIFSADL